MSNELTNYLRYAGEGVQVQVMERMKPEVKAICNYFSRSQSITKDITDRLILSIGDAQTIHKLNRENNYTIILNN